MHCWSIHLRTRPDADVRIRTREQMPSCMLHACGLDGDDAGCNPRVDLRGLADLDAQVPIST